MTGGKDGCSPPAKAFNIEYEKDPKTGFYDFDKPIVDLPLSWDEWIELPVRGHDSCIHTTNRQIRVPTVIMSVNYDKNPVIEKKNPSSKDIFERDNYTCQYSGRKCHPRELTLDHVISRAEWKRRGLPGSPDTWENLVACYGPINSEKADKSLTEAGLKLIRKPKAPSPMRLSQLITEIRHRDWKIFIERFRTKHVAVSHEESFNA